MDTVKNMTEQTPKQLRGVRSTLPHFLKDVLDVKRGAESEAFELAKVDRVTISQRQSVDVMKFHHQVVKRAADVDCPSEPWPKQKNKETKKHCC